jgi:hypothetical protein
MNSTNIIFLISNPGCLMLIRIQPLLADLGYILKRNTNKEGERLHSFNAENVPIMKPRNFVSILARFSKK